MFLDLDKKEQHTVAAIDDQGLTITYGKLCAFSNEFYSFINKRTLIFILSENTVGAMAGYTASLDNSIVPLLVSTTLDREQLTNLLELYTPEYLWVPTAIAAEFGYTSIFSKYGYSLLHTGYTAPALHHDLSLLLPTSGSTGSPKLVRHSYNNITANAANVASFFCIDTTHRAIAILPMHYTMGLSVISSHLYAGATLLIVKSNLTDGSFWKFIKEHKATSFTGVPYSYEILSKLRFFRMDLPHLTLLTQGGGKLSAELFTAFAEFAAATGKKFIATYGQTEGTARMAYLPAEKALEKAGSIGVAIPNGQLSIIDSSGNESTQGEATGEMVYRGPNVTLGYAITPHDLVKGDERMGYLSTGDIAMRDAEGYYFIKGRMSRFLKLYGTRVSLDDMEKLVAAEFKTECLCTGNDEKMDIYVTNDAIQEQVLKYAAQVTGLFHKAFEVFFISEIRRNEAGKIIYSTK